MVRNLFFLINYIGKSIPFTADSFYSGIHINHYTRQNPNHPTAERKRITPDICPNSVIEGFHLIDVFLCKSSQYPAKGRFILYP